MTNEAFTAAKRSLFGFFAVFVLAVLLCILSLADDTPAKRILNDSLPKLNGVGTAAVYNIENDTYIFTVSPEKSVPTASFTKMMTALCAYDLLKDRLDDTITVEYSMISRASGNQVGYYVGETVRIRDIFGGLLTRGANDSAFLLCYAANTKPEDFVALMNERAEKFSMADTVYKNPTGLNADGMVTTAYDSVKLAVEFYKNEFLYSLSSTVKYEMPATNKSPERILYNRNALASKVSETGYFDSRITALNAGSTNEAGYYSASAVKSDTLKYIIVALGCSEVDGKNTAYTAASSLASYALSQYGYVDVISVKGAVCEIPVKLSAEADYVSLVPAVPLTLYMPLATDVKTDLTYSWRLFDDYLKAPVTEGETVGTYSVSQNGVLLGSVDLVTKNSLPKSEFLSVLDYIDSFTHSTFFIVTVLAAVVLTVIYFIASAIIRRRPRIKYSRRRKGF